MAGNKRLAIDKTKAGSSQQCAGLNLLQKGCVVSLVFIKLRAHCNLVSNLHETRQTENPTRECDALYTFLDTQVSLAPTHVRCPSVRHTFGFPFCQRLWSPYMKS